MATWWGANVIPASAAELRITLSELAGLVQAVAGDAKIHLNNKPGGFLAGTSASYFAIAGKETPIPLAPKSFALFGSTYAYYVDDLNSESIKISAAGSAVRLTLKFQPNAVISGGCISGECGLAGALPKIVWKNGTIDIDVVPVHFKNSLALEVRNIAISGALSARCVSTGNIFSDGACKAGLGYANRTIAKLKPDLAAKVKDKVNDPATQAGVADGLRKYLTVGPSGAIAITNVTRDAKGVTISFQLADAVGG